MWRDCWRTFHAAYREEMAPLGLLVHAPSGIVAILKRGGLVFCRPMSSLETLAQAVTDDAPAELRPYSATVPERLVRCASSVCSCTDAYSPHRRCSGRRRPLVAHFVCLRAPHAPGLLGRSPRV